MTSHSIQNFIDENKLDLTDEIYKKLSDKCLLEHQKESEELVYKTGYYNIKYFEDSYEERNYKYTHSLIKKSMILKINITSYQKIKKYLDREKYCIADVMEETMCLVARLTKNVKKENLFIIKKCKECNIKLINKIPVSECPIIVKISDISLKKEKKKIKRRKIKIGQFYKITYLTVEYEQNLDTHKCRSYKENFESIIQISNTRDITLFDTVTYLLDTQGIYKMRESDREKLTEKLCNQESSELFGSFSCTNSECNVANLCKIKITKYPIIVKMELVS